MEAKTFTIILTKKLNMLKIIKKKLKKVIMLIKIETKRIRLRTIIIRKTTIMEI